MYDNEHPNRWLISYADFITLLFAFFVVMYAISSVNQQKYMALNTSLNEAFSNKTNTEPNIAVSKNKREKEEHIPADVLNNMSQKLANQLSPFIMDGKVRVMQNKQVLRVDIHESLLFENGSTKLSAGANKILNLVARVLNAKADAQDNPPHNQVLIESHTDNAPVMDADYPSNWSFSAARASKLVETLNQAGVEASRLSASGVAASYPIEQNSTPLGRARNRRISIVIPILSAQSYESYQEISPRGVF